MNQEELVKKIKSITKPLVTGGMDRDTYWTKQNRSGLFSEELQKEIRGYFQDNKASKDDPVVNALNEWAHSWPVQNTANEQKQNDISSKIKAYRQIGELINNPGIAQERLALDWSMNMSNINDPYPSIDLNTKLEMQYLRDAIKATKTHEFIKNIQKNYNKIHCSSTIPSMNLDTLQNLFDDKPELKHIPIKRVVQRYRSGVSNVGFDDFSIPKAAHDFFADQDISDAEKQTMQNDLSSYFEIREQKKHEYYKPSILDAMSTERHQVYPYGLSSNGYEAYYRILHTQQDLIQDQKRLQESIKEISQNEKIKEDKHNQIISILEQSEQGNLFKDTNYENPWRNHKISESLARTFQNKDKILNKDVKDAAVQILPLIKFSDKVTEQHDKEKIARDLVYRFIKNDESFKGKISKRTKITQLKNRLWQGRTDDKFKGFIDKSILEALKQFEPLKITAQNLPIKSKKIKDPYLKI